MPQRQDPQQRQPTPIVYDASFDSIDQVLALALLYGFDGKRQTRMVSLSLSRNDLGTATFLDLTTQFYKGTTINNAFNNAINVGMREIGPPSATPAMFEAAVAKPEYTRVVAKLTDTADPVALIRNAVTALNDETATVVLSGSPVNLLAVLANPDGREWVKRKVKLLIVAAGRFDSGVADPQTKAHVEELRKLIAEWPSNILFAGAELGDATPFAGAGVDTDFAWAMNHPIVDVYRANKKMPYDAPSRTLAAMLHAAQPDQGYFRISAAGRVDIATSGSTAFNPMATGKHRFLIIDPDQKKRVVQAYAETVSAQPPPPPQRRGPPPAAVKAIALAALLTWTTLKVSAQSTFDSAVRPLLTTCATCHNATTTSGGLDVTALSQQSLTDRRQTWDRMLRRVRAGEMPPQGFPKPPADRVANFTNFVQGAFDKADAATPADPGRVTARRLNRNEYSNTIRDLLGVQFRAEKYFPTDDSGEGFDNIGDVLTVSPVLMDRYLAAAEQIARWAISTDIPPKPVETLYHIREQKVRRLDRSTIEAEHRVEYAGDYTIRIGLPGERAKDAAPVTLAFWMDGKLLASKTVETKPSGLVYFDPYSEEELRVYLPEGDHVFQAGFVGDAFVSTVNDRDAYNRKVNKFLDSILFIGPFKSATPKESRNKVLECDPASGRTCLQRIVTKLARGAYRRNPTPAEVNSLMRFADMSQRDGGTPEQGLQLAIQAMLVSPNFLFRVDRSTGKQAKQISEFDLATRLSYFLWSSTPDEELLGLAESGKLRASLDKQIDRMLRDPRSSAFADNFAGQWLETRNLDVVKPDPDKFPAWNPVLRDAMKRETSMFFDYVLRENKPVSDFINSNYTFVNERLAQHYGLKGVTGAEFRRVELPAGSPRGGVLGQAAVLTVSSYPTRTSPVIRGKYVLNNVLGTPPPPPPPDVPPLDESKIGAAASLREQLEKHRADPGCASCHSKMDPLGFGLENFDAIGRWREKDGNFAIDSSGTLPNGKSFTTPAEMRGVLSDALPQFSRTLVEKTMIYALGRGLKPTDDRIVDGINQTVARDGYRFQTLIRQVVNSLPFQSSRGE